MLGLRIIGSFLFVQGQVMHYPPINISFHDLSNNFYYFLEVLFTLMAELNANVSLYCQFPECFPL